MNIYAGASLNDPTSTHEVHPLPNTIAVPIPRFLRDIIDDKRSEVDDNLASEDIFGHDVDFLEALYTAAILPMEDPCRNEKRYAREQIIFRLAYFKKYTSVSAFAWDVYGAIIGAYKSQPGATPTFSVDLSDSEDTIMMSLLRALLEFSPNYAFWFGATSIEPHPVVPSLSKWRLERSMENAAATSTDRPTLTEGRRSMWKRGNSKRHSFWYFKVNAIVTHQGNRIGLNALVYPQTMIYRHQYASKEPRLFIGA